MDYWKIFLQSTNYLCTEWTFERTFLEIFLAIVFIGNLSSFYFVSTIVKRRQANHFVSNCIVFINVINIFTVSLLLFCPFAFSWMPLPITNINQDNGEGENLTDQLFANVGNYSSFSNLNAMNLVHSCVQRGELLCRISGFLFSIFLNLPLTILTAITIDVTLWSFQWQTYQFRHHTVSTIRLTLFCGFLFYVLMLSGLPSFGIGTHYYYNPFLKICWFSAHEKDYHVKGFAYIIFGSVCINLFMIISFGFATILAYKANVSTALQEDGQSYAILFNRYWIMKSKAWSKYAQLILWIDVLALLAYLPLVVGYFMRHQLIIPNFFWFNLVNEISVFIFPAIYPILVLIICKEDLKTKKCSLVRCLGYSYKKSRKISPSSMFVSEWSMDNSFNNIELQNLDLQSSLEYGKNRKCQQHKFADSRRNYINLGDIYPKHYAQPYNYRSSFSNLYFDNSFHLTERKGNTRPTKWNKKFEKTLKESEILHSNRYNNFVTAKYRKNLPSIVRGSSKNHIVYPSYGHSRNISSHAKLLNKRYLSKGETTVPKTSQMWKLSESFKCDGFDQTPKFQRQDAFRKLKFAKSRRKVLMPRYREDSSWGSNYAQNLSNANIEREVINDQLPISIDMQRRASFK